MYRLFAIATCCLLPCVAWSTDTPLTDAEVKTKAAGRARAIIAIIEIELSKCLEQKAKAPKADPVPQPPKILPPKVLPKPLPKVSIETAPLLGPGWHRHKCPRAECGHVWSHGPGVDRDHVCPACRRASSTVHYTGPSPVQWIEHPAPVPAPAVVVPRIIQSAVPVSPDDCAS